MTTPALQFLAERFPNAKIDILTSPEGTRITPYLPVKVNRTIELDRAKWNQMYLQYQVNREIAKTGYDMILCFESNPIYRKMLSKHSRKIFFPDPRPSRYHFARSSLDTAGKADHVQTGTLDKRRYPIRLTIDDLLKERVSKYFSEGGITDATFVVGIHPSFSGTYKPHKILKRRKHKLWPHEHYANLSDGIAAILRKKGVDYRIFMNLLPIDKKIANKIKSYGTNRIEEFKIPSGFGNFLAYLSRLDVLIVPDTGPMHMAAALGANVISLFSGEDPEICGPWLDSPGVSSIRAEAVPCGKVGVAGITPEIVLDIFEDKMSYFLSHPHSSRNTGN